MRHMPKIIHADPHDAAGRGKGMEVPSLPVVAWDSLVRGVCFAMFGRPLTKEELAEIERAAVHGWTARVTCDHIVQREITNEEWERLTADAKGTR